MNSSRQIYNLQEIFNELSYYHNSPIDLSTLKEFLDNRCVQGKFDRDVFEQLAEQIRLQDGKATINDFINIVLKAQGVLSDKLISAQQKWEQNHNNLAQYVEKLNQLQFTEINNGFQNSILNIDIQEGQINYKSGGLLQVRLNCGTQQYLTKSVLKSQALWNQTYEFKINYGDEKIDVFLLDKDIIGEVAAYTQLSVQDFIDQSEHDMWIELADRISRIPKALLHVKIQWIYSRKQYLQNLITQTKQEIEELRVQILDHKTDLNLLSQPFLRAPKRIDEISKPNQPVIIQSYSAFPQPQQLQEYIDRLLRISLLLIICYFLITSLVNFERCVFVDYLVIFYQFLFYQKNHKLQSLLHIKVIIGMLVFVIFADIVWLSIYSTPYMSDLNVFYDHPEFFLHKYTVVISWIMLLLKIAIIGFYIHIYATYPDKQTQVYDQQWQSIFGNQSVPRIN
ncbi:hypothetical protein pb186bvf_013041 [Paramecium bursaria]